MSRAVQDHQRGPDFSLERQALEQPQDLFQTISSSHYVLGIDEAGRGPWAGPVTAAAAWINPNALSHLPQGLNDSKKISAIKRAALFEELRALPETVFRFTVASREAALIDDNGILTETFAAMDQAASVLIDDLVNDDQEAVTILVDGNLAPKMTRTRDRLKAPPQIIPVIKGDARSLSIAAASIMAKETRDRIMTSLDQEHPQYGWATNMGYGTADHRAALAKHGPTQWHRLSYKPVALIATQFGYTR